MTSPAQRGVETRRLYCFESIFAKELPFYVRRARSKWFLEELLRQVWIKHGRKGVKTPRLTFGEGTPHAGHRSSFADRYSHIELVPGDRNVMILLHEITHTLGFGAPHGRGFARKYVDLLVEYGRCDEGELNLAFALFKVKS